MPIYTNSMLLKKRRTKIVATVGPASSSEAMLENLINAGVDVFRLNMSHGDQAAHGQTFERARAAAARLGRSVAILADLSGPKIRCGNFENGSIELETGKSVTLTTRDVPGSTALIPSQYEGLAGDVRKGDRILLDDGNLELHVDDVAGTEIACTVVHGGTLKSRKGMNLPGVAVSAPSLTDKDIDDAQFAIGLGVDFLALSFVRRAADVDGLRKIVEASGKRIGIISKIEKPEALADIDGIIDSSDGIMVARGDLGVELPPEKVPIAQSQLVDLARAKNIPVIVATQMLESMIENARPTRAEVTDVSNAVMSGADAIMLSAETASGAFPVRAVEMMDRVARETESYLWKEGAFGSIVDQPAPLAPIPVGHAVARTTAQLSRDLLVRAIVVISTGGTTARMVSSARPAAPVLALSADPATCRRVNLLWGVVPIEVDGAIGDPHELSRRIVHELGLASAGDYVLRVSGFNPDKTRNVPTVSVLEI